MKWYLFADSTLIHSVGDWLADLDLLQYENTLVGNGYDDMDFVVWAKHRVYTLVCCVLQMFCGVSAVMYHEIISKVNQLVNEFHLLDSALHCERNIVKVDVYVGICFSDPHTCAVLYVR